MAHAVHNGLFSCRLTQDRLQFEGQSLPHLPALLPGGQPCCARKHRHTEHAQLQMFTLERSRRSSVRCRVSTGKSSHPCTMEQMAVISTAPWPLHEVENDQLANLGVFNRCTGHLEQLTLQPIDMIEGHVKLPGSKSLSNRILLLAALAKGTTIVRNLLVSNSASP